MNKCHAEGCKRPVKEGLYMCAKHWKLVPKRMKAVIYKEYRLGRDKK